MKSGCPLMALNEHPATPVESLLLRAKRTLFGTSAECVCSERPKTDIRDAAAKQKAPDDAGVLSREQL
jgi:hypothetical protein